MLLSMRRIALSDTVEVYKPQPGSSFQRIYHGGRFTVSTFVGVWQLLEWNIELISVHRWQRFGIGKLLKGVKGGGRE